MDSKGRGLGTQLHNPPSTFFLYQFLHFAVISALVQLQPPG